jgi:hypothetical protein
MSRAFGWILSKSNDAESFREKLSEVVVTYSLCRPLSKHVSEPSLRIVTDYFRSIRGIRGGIEYKWVVVSVFQARMRSVLVWRLARKDWHPFSSTWWNYADELRVRGEKRNFQKQHICFHLNIFIQKKQTSLWSASILNTTDFASFWTIFGTFVQT